VWLWYQNNQTNYQQPNNGNNEVGYSQVNPNFGFNQAPTPQYTPNNDATGYQAGPTPIAGTNVNNNQQQGNYQNYQQQGMYSYAAQNQPSINNNVNVNNQGLQQNNNQFGGDINNQGFQSNNQIGNIAQNNANNIPSNNNNQDFQSYTGNIKLGDINIQGNFEPHNDPAQGYQQINK